MWFQQPLEDGEDGQPRVMAYNLEEYKRAPDRTRPLLVSVTLELRAPDDKGMPGEEERARLKDLAEILDGNVYHAVRGKYVMRTIGGGVETHYFHIPDRKLGGLFKKRPATDLVREQLAELSEELDDYDLSVEIERDEDWEFYLDAFPSPHPRQWTSDFNALGALAALGDDLSQPRKLEHTVFFEAGERAETFAAEVRERGFETTIQNEDEGGVLVTVAREEPNVRIQHLHGVVLELLELVETHDGEYDGWEARVLGSKEEPGSEVAQEVADRGAAEA